MATCSLSTTPGGFVGRDAELCRLEELLRRARLVTVMGPSGAGKSRLVRELAGRRRAGEVVQVGLDIDWDPERTAEQLTEVVADALGVGDRGGRCALETFTDRYGDPDLLVVLDGCEPVIDLCADAVARILRRCRGLRMLATSLEPLRVPGEILYPLSGLALDAADGLPEAVRLLKDRARAHRPGFRLQDGEAALAVCRRLDGLPLSLELAARLLGEMSVKELLAALENRLDLPADPGPVPARHRELRGAIDHGHGLLTAEERVVFRRLSVLPGKFGLDDAAGVCAAGDLRPVRVRQLVCALQAKSMVTRTHGDAGQARFRLLGHARAYAAERLAQRPAEQTVTRERLVTRICAQARGLVDRYPLDAAVAGRDTCRADFGAVLDQLVRRGDPRRAEVAVALARICWYQRHIGAGRRALDRVLDVASPYRGDVLAWSAVLTAVQGEHGKALRHAETAVGIGRDGDDPARLLRALDALATVRIVRGELAEAETTGRECVALACGTGSRHDVAKSQLYLAWTLLLAGASAEAADLLAEAVPVYQECSTPAARVAVLPALGTLRLAENRPEEAESAFAEVLRAVPPEHCLGVYALEGLAMVSAHRGALARALCLAAAGTRIRRLGVPSSRAWGELVRRTLETHGPRPSEAAAKAAEATGARLRGEDLAGYALDPACPRSEDERAAGSPLTRRQAEVAELVAHGFTDLEIARSLHLSAGTVRTHLRNIQHRLDLGSRVQIGTWAARQPVS